jgi:hypothetical protein
MLLKIFLFILLSTALLHQNVSAQANVSLTFTTDLPRNLFAANTAILISSEPDLAAGETYPSRTTYELLAGRLQQDTKQLGLPVVHVSLTSPAQEDLAQHYRQLKVENLLILHLTPGIKKEAPTLLLLLTPFNGQTSLLTAGQQAYSLLSRSYENLLWLLEDQLKELPSSYFPNQMAPAQVSNVPKRSQGRFIARDPTAAANPLAGFSRHPEITLLLQEGQHGLGGGQHTFFYTLGGSHEKNAGFWGQRIRKDLAVSPQALVHLNKYRNAKTGFLLNRLIFYGSFIAYGFEISRGDGYFNDRQKVYSGITLASSGVRLLMNRHTNRHMQRAVEEYNDLVRPENIHSLGNWKPDQLSLGILSGNRLVPGLTLRWGLPRLP